MISSTTLVLDNLVAEGGASALLSIVNSIAIAIILLMSAFSLYFSQLQPAKIKALEVSSQTPLSHASHTVVFTNYGAKTGVVIGPEIESTEKARVEDKQGNEVVAIKPGDTVVQKLEVVSDADNNFDYTLFYKDLKGNKILLNRHTYKAQVA